jgi:hypothetical protein
MTTVPLSTTAAADSGTSTHDYVLEGPKWGASAAPGTAGGVVTYSFATGDYSGQPFHYDTPALDHAYQAAVENAFADWSHVANITFKEVPDSAASDIRIGWEHIDGPFNVLAQTTYSYDTQGHMQHAWIGLDDSEFYAPNGPNGALALTDGFTFQAIAEHEIGHAIGLDHYNAATALMNAVISTNSLQTPDIDGVDALYGAAPPAAVASATGAASADDNAALTTDSSGDLLGSGFGGMHIHHHAHYENDWLLA